MQLSLLDAVEGKTEDDDSVHRPDSRVNALLTEDSSGYDRFFSPK